MSDQPSMGGSALDPETRRGVIRWLIREILGVVIVAVTLFWPAGTLAWGWGWALVAVYALWSAANGLILYSRSPGLLAERGSRREGGKTWDMVIMSVVGLLTIAKHVIAGFDYRYGWTATMPFALQFVALLVSALGYALGSWAMAANAYFSLVVRIQEERGHAVASGGPYRWVRHPGYVGTIAFELSSPVLLGSWWALIPGALSALLIVIRTALEDRALLDELEGYPEYAGRVRYRLLPGVW